MSKLYLVRHGQTTSNTIHALDTALPGADLTELGREQASNVGSILAERVDGPLLVMSSQAARAQQTAVLLADSFVARGGTLASTAEGSDFASGFAGSGLSPISDATSAGFGLSHTEKVSTLSDIAEIAAGDYEMRNDEDAHEAYHRVLFRWLHGELEVPVDGAKNGAEILSAYIAQIMSVLNALPESTDVAVVSHGAIIRFIARYLGGLDPEWAFAGYLANTHFVELDVPDNVRELAEAAQDEPDAVEGAFNIAEWGALGTPDRLEC